MNLYCWEILSDFTANDAQYENLFLNLKFPNQNTSPIVLLSMKLYCWATPVKDKKALNAVSYTQIPAKKLAGIFLN